MNEADLVRFQIKRQFINNGKMFLSLLEDKFEYISRLEKLLEDAGFEHFKENKLDYNKDRAAVLSKVNDSWRELFIQLDMFDIKLNKNGNLDNIEK